MQSLEVPADLRSALLDALDVVADGVILFDAGLRVLYFNRGAERIFGLSAADVLGQQLPSLMPPHLMEIHQERIRAFAASPDFSARMGQPLEVQIPRRDGSSLPVEAVVTKLAHGARQFFLVGIRDMSHHVKAERVLQESEERYRSLYENSLDGILLSAPDGRIFAANPAACAILGRTEEEICRVGRHGLQDHDDPRWAEGLRQRTETGAFWGELSFLRPDGSRLICDVSSSIFRDREGEARTTVIFRDATERKESENALRQQEALLRKILEILPLGVWSLDKEGRVQWYNEASHRIWAGALYVGIEEYGEYKAWWPESGLPVQAEDWAAARAVRTGATVVEEQVNIEAFDGTRKTILNSAVPILDADGAVMGAIAINQDVTERVQAYQLLEQRVDERTRELTALLETSRNIAATLELEPLLTALLTQLKCVIDYAGAGIALLEDDNTLRMLDYAGPAPREKMLVTIPLDRDSGYRQVVLGREPYIIDDIWGDSEWIRGVRREWGGPSLSAEIHSWLGVPLIAKGRLIGVLRLDHVQPGYFTREHAHLALAFANQAAVAMENARLYEQAQQLAVLEERQRLARELHDSVSQALYGMTLGARTARALVQQDPARATEALDYVLSLTEAAFAEMRALIFELRPDSLAEEGLVVALNRQADLVRARHHLAMETEFCDEPRLPLAVKTALYRIGQEMLNNVVKHARAAHVALRLAQDEDAVVLQVMDDGVGFDADGQYPGHLGLRLMRERAEGAGGTLKVGPGAEGGTVAEARVPVVGS
jgi:PAS domain S-box-containing protein